MLSPDFTIQSVIFYFIYLGLRMLTLFIVAKLFIGGKLSQKEGFYILLVTVLCAAFRGFPTLYRFFTGYWDGPVGFFTIGLRILTIVFLILYFYRINTVSLRKSFLFAVFADLIAALSAFLGDLIYIQLLGFRVNFTDPTLALIRLTFPVSTGIISIGITLFIVRATKKLQKKLDTNTHLLTILMIGSLVGWLTYQVVFISFHFVHGTAVTLWLPALLFGYVSVALLSFLFYFRHRHAVSSLREKETEHKNLQFYLSEIGEQQQALRKFKHDYQNILASFEGFLNSDDLDGLKQYYNDQIKTTQTLIQTHDFTLSRLNHIKVKEVNGILMAKLATAQNRDIDVSLEIYEDINHIHLDSVTLVRMLGIMLDNAIEELTELGKGKLQVACFSQGQAVVFIIKNTCREDIPPLYQLEKDGFSSKGKGRGQGLSNLADFARSQPNLILQTELPKGSFIQKLTIG